MHYTSSRLLGRLMVGEVSGLKARKGIERIKLSGRGTFFCPECQADTPPTA